MKAKKLISSILAIAVIATSMSHNVFAATGDVVLEGAQVQSKIGGDFSVNFNLTSVPSTGFSGSEFAIKYDPTKITIESVTAGSITNTGATEAEVDMSPTFNEERVMVNGNSLYNCFDYNIMANDGLLAVIWCTGLEDSKYWINDSGVFFTVKGKVSANAKVGEKYDLEIVPINRNTNEQIIFGYVENEKDSLYTAKVTQNGQVEVIDDSVVTTVTTTASETTTTTTSETTTTTTSGTTTSSTTTVSSETGKEPVWGDMTLDGLVRSNDLVYMTQYLLGDLDASEQSLLNGNVKYDLKDGKNNVDMNDLSKFKQYFLRVFDNFKKLGPDTEAEVALWKSSSDYKKLNP